MFWENYVELCIKNNTSPNAVAKAIGISSASVTYWKNGSKPRDTALKKIANYFDVSTDYLLGRTTTINEINSHNNISGNNNIIGNGYNTGDNLLTEQETALVSIFKSLDVINQAKLLTYAAELQKNTIEKN